MVAMIATLKTNRVYSFTETERSHLRDPWMELVYSIIEIACMEAQGRFADSKLNPTVRQRRTANARAWLQGDECAWYCEILEIDQSRLVRGLKISRMERYERVPLFEMEEMTA